MKRCCIILFLIPFAYFGYAQQFFVKKWDKRYGGTDGEFLYNLCTTKDGGYLLNGFSYSGIGGDKSQVSWGQSDYWVVKLDSAGIKEWDKRFGGIGTEGFNVIIETKDGGYLLGGNSNPDSTGDQTLMSRGGNDYWVIKIDSSGAKQWDKRFGGNLTERFGALLQTADGGYLLGGASNSGINGDKTEENWDVSHFSDDGWIVKIDSVGNKQWDKKYGGTEQDAVVSILQTNDKGFLLGCYTASDNNGDKTQPWWGSQLPAYWIVKTDSLGNKQWDKRYGGTGGEYFFELTSSIDGGYVLCGQSASDSSGDKTTNRWNNSLDYWMVKIDSLGNKEWDKNFGGMFADELYTVVSTLDGGYLLSGRSQSYMGGDKTEDNLGSFQIWIVKTDASGNKQWDKTIFTTGPCDGGYAIQTHDGCYLAGNSNENGIGGYKTQVNWNGSSDYWIIKFCMDTVTSIGNEQLTTNNVRIQVYPNPFTSDISIALQKENLGDARFTVSTILGQVVFKKEETNLADSYTKMLDLSYLPNGIYLLEVVVDGERMVRQIVKQ